MHRHVGVYVHYSVQYVHFCVHNTMDYRCTMYTYMYIDTSLSTHMHNYGRPTYVSYIRPIRTSSQSPAHWLHTWEKAEFSYVHIHNIDMHNVFRSATLQGAMTVGFLSQETPA